MYIYIYIYIYIYSVYRRTGQPFNFPPLSLHLREQLSDVKCEPVYIISDRRSFELIYAFLNSDTSNKPALMDGGGVDWKDEVWWTVVLFIIAILFNLL